MFRSYDHLQAEIYTSEINITELRSTETLEPDIKQLCNILVNICTYIEDWLENLKRINHLKEESC
jgi:hypothetical protein